MRYLVEWCTELITELVGYVLEKSVYLDQTQVREKEPSELARGFDDELIPIGICRRYPNSA